MKFKHPYIWASGLAPSMLILMIACGHDAKSEDKAPAVAPTIVTQPVNQEVLAGTNAHFDVVVTGSEPLTYQWTVNGNPAAGEVRPRCTVWAATMAGDGAIFTVTVSNIAGSVTSLPATLRVVPIDQPPVIVTHPTDQVVTEGSPAYFEVTAVGTGPLTYQWSRNGRIIEGHGFPRYTLATTSRGDHGALFTVDVANHWGSVTSTSAQLTVN